MTVQDVDIPSTAAEKRHLGAAAVAAVGAYLVIAVSRVIETFFYVVGSYWQDPLAYLRAMLQSAAPEWFVTPLPFAFAVWLGLGVIVPIRAWCSTRSVVLQSLLTSLIGLVLAGLFNSAATAMTTAMTTLLTVGTLATLSAGLLLRDHLRKVEA